MQTKIKYVQKDKYGSVGKVKVQERILEKEGILKIVNK